MPLLSVIIPAYNEEATIAQIIAKVNAIKIDKEIIVVENGSFDDTAKILGELKCDNMKVIYLSPNRGKGGAILTGLAHASGEFIIIQDADLEYDPNDYVKLLRAIQLHKADLVLGARFFHGYHGLFFHKIGNKFLTWLLNALFHTQINDYATCYKLARRSTWEELCLRGTGFDIDVEIICKALKKKKKMIDEFITYSPRSYQEGKKIRFYDAFWTVYYMLKYRFGR